MLTFIDMVCTVAQSRHSRLVIPHDFLLLPSRCRVRASVQLHVFPCLLKPGPGYLAIHRSLESGLTLGLGFSTCSYLRTTMSTEQKPETNDSLEKADSQVDTSGSEHLADFGGESLLPPPPTLTVEEERKLWRKIDIRLMPILALMYLFSFLDRGRPYQCWLNLRLTSHLCS